MIEIKFPADRSDIALAIGVALTTIARGKPAEPAPEKPENVDAPAPTAEPIVDEHAPTDPIVDEKGVAKDDTFCSTAAEPFYSTGKRAGQWKKRKGISDYAYDIWYEDQLDGLCDDDLVEAAAQEVKTHTAAAFAPAPQQAPPAVDPNIPTECGPFMAWVASKQAAGALTQEQVGAAYATAGLEVADLFTPAPEQVALNVAALYGILSAAAGGA